MSIDTIWLMILIAMGIVVGIFLFGKKLFKLFSRKHYFNYYDDEPDNTTNVNL